VNLLSMLAKGFIHSGDEGLKHEPPNATEVHREGQRKQGKCAMH